MFQNEDFLHKLQINEYSILSKFKSKKNEVYLIEGEDFSENKKKYIVKRYKKNNFRKEKSNYYKYKFCNECSIEKEIKILMGLKKEGVSVPQVYCFDERTIIMEYIEGKNIVDIIEETEARVNEFKSSDIELIIQIFVDLFVWLNNFYKVIKDVYGEDFIFGDVNLRNFIVSDKIYGIDFEDCNIGWREEDGGRLCAFILTYTPCFSSFKINLVTELYEVLINNFYYDSVKLKKEIIKELYNISRRRNIDIPLNTVDIIKRY